MVCACMSLSLCVCHAGVVWEGAAGEGGGGQRVRVHMCRWAVMCDAYAAEVNVEGRHAEGPGEDDGEDWGGGGVCGRKGGEAGGRGRLEGGEGESCGGGGKLFENRWEAGGPSLSQCVEQEQIQARVHVFIQTQHVGGKTADDM